MRGRGGEVTDRCAKIFSNNKIRGEVHAVGIDATQVQDLKLRDG
jgi:hypothetical protein